MAISDTRVEGASPSCGVWVMRKISSAMMNILVLPIVTTSSDRAAVPNRSKSTANIELCCVELLQLKVFGYFLDLQKFKDEKTF